MTLEHIDTVFAFSAVMLLLSLVITILVQAVVALGGLRGKNLIWGVTKILERSPDLKQYATEMAKAALTHPALTIRGKPATAVGSKELMAVLYDLADPKNQSLKAQAKTALSNLLQEKVPASSQAHAEKLAEAFKDLFPEESKKMQVVENLQNKANQLTNDFETWFDTVMNRTTDRFVLYTRYWTITFAVMLAFVLHIDSIQMIRQLSTDAEMRATLIGMADQSLERAEAILRADSIAVRALQSISDGFPEGLKAEIPTSIATRGQGEAWIERTIADEQLRASLLGRYGAEFDQIVRERLGELGDEATSIKKDLEESRLAILSGGLPPFKEYAKWKHLLGVLISAMLLGLGAPFWFNALRTLASLRPILAGRTDPSKQT